MHTKKATALAVAPRWLGYLDSNQEWMNQNHLCCQLHHTPIGRRRSSWNCFVGRTPDRI